MQHNLPNFVVVIHPASACSDAILYALRVTKTCALQSMTYSEWLSSDKTIENNVLYLRENGELLHIKDASELAHIREEIAALSEELV